MIGSLLLAFLVVSPACASGAPAQRNTWEYAELEREGFRLTRRGLERSDDPQTVLSLEESAHAAAIRAVVRRIAVRNHLEGDDRFVDRFIEALKTLKACLSDSTPSQCRSQESGTLHNAVAALVGPYVVGDKLQGAQELALRDAPAAFDGMKPRADLTAVLMTVNIPGASSGSRVKRPALSAQAEPMPNAQAQAPQESRSLLAKTEVFEKRSDDHMTPMGLLGPSADSAIWTGAYVAAEAYRYAATQDPDALRRMEKSLRALHALHEATGVPGLIARDIVPKNPATGKEDKMHEAHGKYEGYLWKGHLSFDQYLGYLYGISEAWPHIQDQELKALIKEDVRQIGLHFIEHDGKIQALDTYLDSSPRYYYQDLWPKWLRWLSWVRYLLPNRGGNSMHGLHIMKVAAYVTQDPKILEYYRRELVEKKGYVKIVESGTSGGTERSVRRWLWLINILTKLRYGFDVQATPDSLRAGVGMNLGHIALYNLSRLEEDPEIRRSYLKALQGTHEPVARHSNTYWNFLAASQTGGDPHAVSEGIDSLEKFPLEGGVINNSEDPSIPKYKGLQSTFFKSNQGWQWYAYEPLPFKKRPMHSFAWQQNAMRMDGDYEPGEAGGADYLAAYWLGRRYGFISPEQ